MNLVMYILVNKDLKGKMTAQKLSGQVAHAASTWIYKHSSSKRIDNYLENNQTKIILECPEKKLLEYEKYPTMIAIRDAGHTELEQNTLTCVCAGIFDKDKDEIPKEIKRMQLLKWETVLDYNKYYTGKEILELIAKDRLPVNHLIRSYTPNKNINGGVCFIRNKYNEYHYIYLLKSYELSQVLLDFFVSDDMKLLFKIDKEEYKEEYKIE